MSKKEIVVTIDKTGAIQIDAQGFKGKECEAATKAIEKALGTVTKRERKREFYERPLRHTQKQRG